MLNKRLTIGEIEKLTSIEIKNMSDSEIRRMASDYFTAMNKRLKRLEKSGETGAPSYRFLSEEQQTDTPRFSVKGKSTEQIKKELTRAKMFSSGKTSTIRGIKSVKKEIFEVKLGIPIPKEDKLFWEEYRKYLERNSNLVNSKNFDSLQAQRLIAKQYQDGDIDDKYINSQSVTEPKNIEGDWN